MTAIILRRRVIHRSSRAAAQRAARRWFRANGYRASSTTRLVAEYGCAVRAFLVASHDELSAMQQAEVLGENQAEPYP